MLLALGDLEVVMLPYPISLHILAMLLLIAIIWKCLFGKIFPIISLAVRGEKIGNISGLSRFKEILA